MRKIMAVMALSVVTLLTATVASASANTAADGDTGERQQVSRAQYRILINQCRYANTARARRICRAQVPKQYSIGLRNQHLDCRTYASVTVCGELMLSPSERECVRDSVSRGLTRRRAEVECYVYL